MKAGHTRATDQNLLLTIMTCHCVRYLKNCFLSTYTHRRYLHLSQSYDNLSACMRSTLCRSMNGSATNIPLFLTSSFHTAPTLSFFQSKAVFGPKSTHIMFETTRAFGRYLSETIGLSIHADIHKGRHCTRKV